MLKRGDIMVIYDMKDNHKGKIKGMLYLNIIDVDYIVSKYGIDALKSMLPMDYVECFDSELKQICNEHKLSEQYYSIVSLGIETESDQRLLDILRDEVAAGIIFSKQELRSISTEEVRTRIEEMSYVEQKVDEVTPEELYKFRSYKMAEYIIATIEDSNSKTKKMYEIAVKESPSSMRYMRLYREYITNIENLKVVGLSSTIEESNYFVGVQKVIGNNHNE